MDLHMFTSLFLTFWSIHASSGQLVRTGRCPEVEVKQDFDLDRYLGTWYQHATFGTRLFQGEGRCVTAQYTFNTTTGKVDVLNSQIPKKGTFPAQSSIRGTAELADPNSNEAKLVVTFPAPVIRSIKAPYWVLDTDYGSFAVVYSCVDFVVAHSLSGWILTRQQDVGQWPEARARLEAAVQAALATAHSGLQTSLFQATDQTHCDSDTGLDQ